MKKQGIAIVNASPLIFLSRGGHLELLRVFAETARVPKPVADEILARGKDDPTVRAMQRLDWMAVVPVKAIPPGVQEWGLGNGESAVIALALSLPGATAVLDDLAGRKCAASFGIPVRGTLGIVLLAKRCGVVPQARPVLEDLIRGGMYLSRPVLDAALAKVGE